MGKEHIKFYSESKRYIERKTGFRSHAGAEIFTHATAPSLTLESNRPPSQLEPVALSPGIKLTTLIYLMPN